MIDLQIYAHFLCMRINTHPNRRIPGIFRHIATEFWARFLENFYINTARPRRIPFVDPVRACSGRITINHSIGGVQMNPESNILYVVLPVVFIALILLSLAIWLLTRGTGKRGANKKPGPSIQTKDPEFLQTRNSHSDQLLAPEELIAVLTAAVQAYADSNPDCRIRVKSFRRVPQNTPAWNMEGRKEYISNKL